MKVNDIVIIDYGLGNLKSIYNTLRRLGISSSITSEVDKIYQAKKLILPGVGHFENGMKNLRKLNLIEILHEKVIEQKTPILGICLGMQLFTKWSEEWNIEVLGWIDAKTILFKFTNLVIQKN